MLPLVKQAALPLHNTDVSHVVGGCTDSKIMHTCKLLHTCPTRSPHFCYHQGAFSVQVAFGRFEQNGHALQQLVQQASNIAWLHCALSLSDWALMLSLPYSWPAKIQVGATAVVAYALVQHLRSKALDSNWFLRNL